MLLTTEPALLLVMLLWLPLLALVGALHTAVGWRASRRYGHRALAASWVASTAAIGAVLFAFARTSASSWGSPAPAREGLLAAAIVALPVAVCLAVPTAFVARRFRSGGAVARARDAAVGAALTAGAWVAVGALALAGFRLHG